MPTDKTETIIAAVTTPKSRVFLSLSLSLGLGTGLHTILHIYIYMIRSTVLPDARGKAVRQGAWQGQGFGL